MVAQSEMKKEADGYKTMMDELLRAQRVAEEPIPAEYQRVADIYRPGGAYGAGALSRIRREQRAGVAGTMSQLIGAGMSSGAMAAGVRARYGREATEAMQGVEDERTRQFTSALSALAAARTARGLRMSQAYQTTAQLLQSYITPIQQTEISGQYGLQQTAMKGAFDLLQQRREQQFGRSMAETGYKKPGGYEPYSPGLATGYARA